MNARADKKPSIVKRMIWMIIGVLVLIGIIAGAKVMLVLHKIHSMPKPEPATVSTMRARDLPWQPTLKVVGSLRAVRGADLAMEVSGLVTAVDLKSGEDVKKGQLLLQLRAGDEVAKLQELQAAAQLAALTFQRDRQQLSVRAISKATYDAAAADLKAKQAAVDQQQVIVSKKQLRAPFDGRAGIITINPGDYVSPGSTVVTLQQLDTMYVDFDVPQNELGRLKPGQKVILSVDAYPGKTFDGTINAISPKVDTGTRNAQAEATVPNPDHLLTPGMFARVSVDVGREQQRLTLPQSAIVYNPYGDSVYVVHPSKGKDQQGKPLPPTVKQTFVTTGATRGDQVEILNGISAGTEVVTSGQIKLKSGARIRVDNSVQPPDSAHPTPQEH